jgi:hypothetical protein
VVTSFALVGIIYNVRSAAKHRAVFETSCVFTENGYYEDKCFLAKAKQITFCEADLGWLER